MSRRHRAEKKAIAPDPVYKSEILAKFINKVMQDGKKSTSRRIVYNALEKFSTKVKAENPLEAFEQALQPVFCLTRLGRPLDKSLIRQPLLCFGLIYCRPKPTANGLGRSEFSYLVFQLSEASPLQPCHSSLFSAFRLQRFRFHCDCGLRQRD